MQFYRGAPGTREAENDKKRPESQQTNKGMFGGALPLLLISTAPAHGHPQFTPMSHVSHAYCTYRIFPNLSHLGIFEHCSQLYSGICASFLEMACNMQEDGISEAYTL